MAREVVAGDEVDNGRPAVLARRGADDSLRGGDDADVDVLKRCENGSEKVFAEPKDMVIG